MKMTPQDFSALKSSIEEVLVLNPKAVPAMKLLGYSDIRICWDIYHHSRIDKHLLGKYNDSHIETALKRIIEVK